MTKRGLFPIISIIPISFIAVYAFQNFNNQTPSPQIKSISAKNPSLQDFELSEYSDAGAYKKFTINGKVMGVAPKRLGIFLVAPFKVLQIKDPEVVFYTKYAQASILSAKKAIFDTPFSGTYDKNDMVKALSRRVEFNGDISVITEDRRTLTCDKLTWDSVNGRFFANGRCVLTYEGKILKGDSGETDVLLKDFSFKIDSKKRLKALGRIF